jgi:26S proteasome regulatory subunit N10
MSMEEEAARQAAAQSTSQAAPSSTASNQPAAQSAAAVASEPAISDDEEERLLQQALSMSEGHDVDMNEQREDDEDLTEEEMIARAIEMSMQGEEEGQEKK